MASTIAKLFNPAFYTQTAGYVVQRAHNYYHPLMRQNKATPLFHAMVGISAIMYTATYYARVYPDQQKLRAIKKQALEEYYEKHGGGDHH
eukprot:CAMPEP_0119545740 /NCGR_PEP_ID=MMETSP1352-20130426/412_1 /TAXON_ID=265584 /ORGANISM="Stauroneis constricta, Strain CCMP1120" /LENGTH=89 /DNA_ID=CAMNT_0007590335 /DNA_START=11 /DNA_END=280 /DNA_ORIENTATION=+